MKATESNIKSILDEVSSLVESSDLDINISLTDQGVDSLDLVNVYLLVEEKFEIKIPDEDIAQLQNISQIIDYVNLKVT